MYFAKALGHSANVRASNSPRFNLEPVFRVSDRVVLKHREKYRSALQGSKDDRDELADAAAAAFAALFMSGFVRPEIVNELLDLCRITTIGHGYDFVAPDVMPWHAARSCTVVVAGCQNETLLRSRVAAAADLAEEIHRPYTLVFTGANSATVGARIPNEAAFMRAEYFLEMKRRKLVRGDIAVPPVAVESQSTTTLTNIANVISDQELINRQTKTCLVVLSSTFHLMRIARILNDLAANERMGLSQFLSHICLVGADARHAHQYTTEDAASIKSMMFELYSEHMV